MGSTLGACSPRSAKTCPLIPGLQPILTSTIANRLMGETVTRIQWLGLVLGLIGVVLVLHNRDIVMAGSPLGWFASFLSLIGITLGTLYQKRYCGGIDRRARLRPALPVFSIWCPRSPRCSPMDCSASGSTPCRYSACWFAPSASCWPIRGAAKPTGR